MQTKAKYLMGLAAAVMTALLAACSSTGDSRGSTITLTSTPEGATVLADGAEIGTTPLSFNPADNFRAGFSSSGSSLLGYRYMGKLVVKKPGCKDYATEVDDRILSRDITVTLECDPDYQPPEPATAALPVTPPPADAEQRLLRIENLHDKGLISDAEYRSLRQKVLDSL